MSQNINTHVKAINRALRANKTYSKAVQPQVMSLASAMVSLELASEEIAQLDRTTIWEETRYGKKMAPHPAFKIQKDAQDSVTRQMKALGLTVADLGGGTSEDPLVDLTKKITTTTDKDVIIGKQ